MRVEHECVQTLNGEILEGETYSLFKCDEIFEVVVTSVEIIDDGILVVRYKKDGEDGVVGVNLKFHPFQEWIIL